MAENVSCGTSLTLLFSNKDRLVSELLPSPAIANLLQVNISTVKPFWEVTLKILEALAAKQH